MKISVKTAIEVVVGSCSYERERDERTPRARDRRGGSRARAHCARAAVRPKRPAGPDREHDDDRREEHERRPQRRPRDRDDVAEHQQQHRRRHRAADAPHAAEDHDREQARDQVVAAVGVEGVGRAEDHPADRGHRDADADRDHPRAVDVDADQIGGRAVLQRGAHAAAELRAVEHRVEAGHQRRPPCRSRAGRCRRR